MQIYFIGYRASGKTTVGKNLAKMLNYKFLDTDQEIVWQSQLEIADIVKKYGWDFFRKKEKAIINSINPADNLIISLGGGAIIDSDNARTIKQNGTVIFLKTSPNIIKKRLLTDANTKKNRPSLSGADTQNSLHNNTINEVDKILAKREPIYNNISNIIINTDNKQIEQIICEIIEYL